jgi:hypothetical protein
MIKNAFYYLKDADIFLIIHRLYTYDKIKSK